MNTSVVVVIDDEDQILAQQRLSNELAKIVAMVMPRCDEPVGVVVD